MFTRILKTTLLVLLAITVTPILFIETLFAMLITIVLGEGIRGLGQLISAQYKMLWFNVIVRPINFIWDKDETEEEETE